MQSYTHKDNGAHFKLISITNTLNSSIHTPGKSIKKWTRSSNIDLGSYTNHLMPIHAYTTLIKHTRGKCLRQMKKKEKLESLAL